MSSLIEYGEIQAFHPGYYIAEVIEDMGISHAEFAIRLGTTPKNISALVNGQTALSCDMAEKLSEVTGISVSTWLNLQDVFNEKLAEIERVKEVRSYNADNKTRRSEKAETDKAF